MSDPTAMIQRQCEVLTEWVTGLRTQLEQMDFLVTSGTADAAAQLDASDGALEEHTLELRKAVLEGLGSLQVRAREVELHLEDKVGNVHQILGVETEGRAL
ncbi:hypothetical protein [Streptomyces sp. NPDC088360]|uniref:hypothetical protein n=1 Tax=Streptomyces sp. NPDC088360 TaxID=3154515 RepID=UPI00344BCC41